MTSFMSLCLSLCNTLRRNAEFQHMDNNMVSLEILTINTSVLCKDTVASTNHPMHDASLAPA